MLLTDKIFPGGAVGGRKELVFEVATERVSGLGPLGWEPGEQAGAAEVRKGAHRAALVGSS